MSPITEREVASRVNLSPLRSVGRLGRLGLVATLLAGRSN